MVEKGLEEVEQNKNRNVVEKEDEAGKIWVIVVEKEELWWG